MSVDLIGLDLDGVLHRANDSVLVNFREGTPPWQIEIGLKAQRRFVWAPLLVDVLGNSNISIVIHSTWRKHYDDAVLKTFLPPEIARRVIVLDGHIKGRRELSSDDYLAAAIELIAPSSLCVMDDRPEFFPVGGRVFDWVSKNHGRFVWCDPEFGISKLSAREPLSAWLKDLAENESSAPTPSNTHK